MTYREANIFFFVVTQHKKIFQNEPVNLKTSPDLFNISKIRLKFSGEIEDVVDDVYLQIAFNDCTTGADVFELRYGA